MATTRTLVVIGVTHQHAPLAILEKVNLEPDACARLARTLVDIDGTSEAVVLSTCNRTELYLVGRAPDVAAGVLALVAETRTTRGLLDGYVWNMSNDAAVMHLFRVAGGLESRVAGEREILGQVRSAVAVAKAAGALGPYLDSLFCSAVAVGRRAHQLDRTTPVSWPQVGLDAARPDSTKPSGMTVVMGSGAMAAATVEELKARRMDFVICARRLERAARLTSRAEQVVLFDDLALVLERAEVVVCATGARTPLLRVEDVEAVMSRRDGRALVIVDLSLPRNVEPAVGQLPGLRLVDLDDLISGTTQSELRRRAEIITDELSRYRSRQAGQAAAHHIVQLQAHVHAVCQDVLERSLIDAGVSSSAIAAASRTLAGKLLHPPTLAIKRLTAEGDDAAARSVLSSYGIIADKGIIRSESSRLRALRPARDTVGAGFPEAAVG